jgi:RHS repeat-associated protein
VLDAIDGSVLESWVGDGSITDALDPNAERLLSTREMDNYGRSWRLAQVGRQGSELDETLRTELTYDKWGQVSGKRVGHGVMWNDPMFLETYTYDSLGRATGSLRQASAEIGTSAGASSEVVYDELGRVVVSIEKQDGATVGANFHAYDIAGRPTWTSDADGVEQCTRYDDWGRVSARGVSGQLFVGTSYAHGVAHPRDAARSGGYTRITTQPGDGEQYEVYLQAGRTVLERSASGAMSEYFLDGYGRMMTEARFDASGQVLSARGRSYWPGSARLKVLWDWEATALLAAGDAVALAPQAVACEAQGLLPENCTLTASGGASTTLGGVYHRYGADGALVELRDATGETTLITSAPATGLVSKVERSGQMQTQYSYAAGVAAVARVEISRMTGASADADVIVLTSESERGVRPLRSRVERQLPGGASAAWRESVHSYDASGRPVQVVTTDYGAAVVDGGMGTNGLVTHQMSYAYDAAGRLSARTSSTQGVSLTAGYAYTAAGRLSARTYPSGKRLDYGYDAGNGQLQSVHLVTPAAGPGGSEASELVYEVTSRDLAGRVLESEVKREATSLGERTLKMRTYDNGQLVSTALYPVSAADEVGVLIRRETLVHDALGRLATSVQEREGNDTLELRYGHDSSGKLLSEEHLTLQGEPAAAAESYRVDYQYDRAGRRTVVDERADGDGASSGQSPALVRSRSLAYGVGNKLTDMAVTEYVGQSPQSYSFAFNAVNDYSARGEQLVDHRGQSFGWSVTGTLERITALASGAAPAHVTLQLADINNQRLLRLSTEDDGLSYRRDDYLPGEASGTVLYHRATDALGVLAREEETLLLADGQPFAQLVTTSSSSGAQFVPLDVQTGASEMAFGNASNPDELRRYSAFGERFFTGAGASAAGANSELGFHGMQQLQSSALLGQDMAAPLHQAGVRVYDPETGRFLSPDPLGWAAAADPNNAADGYRYAHASPLMLSDASGYLAVPRIKPWTASVQGPVGAVPDEAAHGPWLVAHPDSERALIEWRSSGQLTSEDLRNLTRNPWDTWGSPDKICTTHCPSEGRSAFALGGRSSEDRKARHAARSERLEQGHRARLRQEMNRARRAKLFTGAKERRAYRQDMAALLGGLRHSVEVTVESVVSLAESDEGQYAGGFLESGVVKPLQDLGIAVYGCRYNVGCLFGQVESAVEGATGMAVMGVQLLAEGNGKRAQQEAWRMSGYDPASPWAKRWPTPIADGLFGAAQQAVTSAIAAHTPARLDANPHAAGMAAGAFYPAALGLVALPTWPKLTSLEGFFTNGRRARRGSFDWYGAIDWTHAQRVGKIPRNLIDALQAKWETAVPLILQFGTPEWDGLYARIEKSEVKIRATAVDPDGNPLDKTLGFVDDRVPNALHFTPAGLGASRSAAAVSGTFIHEGAHIVQVSSREVLDSYLRTIGYDREGVRHAIIMYIEESDAFIRQAEYGNRLGYILRPSDGRAFRMAKGGDPVTNPVIRMYLGLNYVHFPYWTPIQRAIGDLYTRRELGELPMEVRAALDSRRIDWDARFEENWEPILREFRNSLFAR